MLDTEGTILMCFLKSCYFGKDQQMDQGTETTEFRLNFSWKTISMSRIINALVEHLKRFHKQEEMLDAI